MKHLLLIMIVFGIAGFILDLYTRVISNKGLNVTVKQAFLLLLNIPVYSIGGGLIFLLYKIPIFSQIKYALLFYFLAGVSCCLVELACGYLLNIKLKLNIWKYTLELPFTIFGKTIQLNIMGQTDLIHLILFTILAIPVVNFTNFLLFIIN